MIELQRISNLQFISYSFDLEISAMFACTYCEQQKHKTSILHDYVIHDHSSPLEIPYCDFWLLFLIIITTITITRMTITNNSIKTTTTIPATTPLLIPDCVDNSACVEFNARIIKVCSCTDFIHV